jgi:hypothetical protein
MKIIITERQQKLISEDEDRDFLVKKKIAKNELKKKFGNLTHYDLFRDSDIVLYLDENKNVYFYYNKKDGRVGIDVETIWLFLEDIFSFNYKQIQQVTKEWLEEHYKLGVTTTASRGNLTRYWLGEP